MISCFRPAVIIARDYDERQRAPFMNRASIFDAHDA